MIARPRRLYRSLPAIALAIAIALTGCGTPATPSPTSAPAKSAAPAPTTAAQPSTGQQPGQPTAAAKPAAAGQFDGTIKIGALISISGAGAAYAPWFKSTYEIATEEVNSKGGINIGGKKYKLELDVQDTASKPEQAVALVRKFTDDNKYLMVHGMVLSSEAQAVYSGLQKKLDDPGDTGVQIPVFSSSPALSGLAKLSAWSFRNVFDEKKLVEDSLVTLKSGLNIKSAGALAGRDDTKTYQTWTDVIKPGLEKAGYEIVGYEEVLTKDTNVSAQISKLKRANPDLWVTSVLAVTAGTVYQEAARQQLTAKARLTMQSATGPELMNLDNAIKDGILVTSGYNLDDPKYATFAQQLTAKGLKGIESSAEIQTYNAILTIKDVFEQAGLSLKPEDLQKDRRKIRDGLANLKNWKGLGGDVFNMLPSQEVDRGGVITELKGGKFVTWQAPSR